MADIEYVYRKEDEGTAKDLYDGCNSGKYSLPMLVVVNNGFYSNREETTFSTGQVLMIHEIRTQDRVLVHDCNKKTLTVPLDYTHRFTVGHSNDALTMREVVELYSHKVPVSVYFADPGVKIDRENVSASGKTFGRLEVVGVHHEVYFIANTIDRGTPLDTVIPVPLYLKEVTFCPVLGMKGKWGSSSLRSLIESQSRKLSHVDFSQDYSDKEMVQLSQKPLKVSDNIYQNIDRHVYVNVSQSRRRPQRDSVASPHSPNPAAAADNDDYDEPQPFPPRRPPKSHMSQASAPATRRQPPPINTSDDDDVYEPVDGEKHMHDPATSSKTDAKRRSIKDGTSAGVPVLKDTSAAMTSELAKVLKKQRQNLEDIPESAASDTRHAAKPTVKNLLLRSKSSEHPDKPPSSTKPSKPAPAVAATLPRVQQASSKPASSQRSTEATYINQQEMAIVKPMGSMTFSQSSVASQSSKQHGPATVKPSPGFQQTPLLSPQGPETTAKLQQKTINDVGEVLEELGLSKYRGKFQKERVDGVLLAMLDEQTLKEDFGMSRIEVIRLMAYVREGHKPVV